RVYEARVVASLSLGLVLRDINRGAAVLAAQCQSLNQTQGDERDRSEEADGCEARQQSDRRCEGAHDDQGREKRLLSSEPISDPAEEESTDGPHREPNGEGRERFEEA